MRRITIIILMLAAAFSLWSCKLSDGTSCGREYADRMLWERTSHSLSDVGDVCRHTALAGILYGCMYYKKNITLGRVLAAKFIVMLLCNVILNTLCLSMLYGQGFLVLLPARLFKNLVMWPVDSVILFSVARVLEGAGVFKLLRCAGPLRRK